MILRSGRVEKGVGGEKWGWAFVRWAGCIA